MIRALVLGLVLAGAGPVYALESSPRPLARGDVAAVGTTPRIRPLAQRASVSMAQAPARVALLRPVSRPYVRPEIARGAATLPQTEPDVRKPSTPENPNAEHRKTTKRRNQPHAISQSRNAYE